MNKTKEERLMKQYGISSTTETFYHFKGHKYHKLADAVAYAKNIDSQNDTSSSSKPNDRHVEID